MKRIRVLVADDHPPIVEGLTAALDRAGIDVVGHAFEPDEVLVRYAELTPDVLVLDIRFGTVATSGFEVARQALRRYPNMRIVAYSQFDQDELLREAYRIGCVGFVTKNKATSVLAEAIRAVHAGKTHFLSEIAERLAMIGLRGDESPLSLLEPREAEVFKQMAQGRTNVEIAEALGLSPKTISITSQTIKDKLGIHRPAEITRLAVRYGVIQA